MNLDLLRFIGISLVILAHVTPPQWLLQIRCFDVPLLVFVSGLAYSNREPDFSFQFMWRRIKRLLVPTYLFLTFYFAAILLMNCFLHSDYKISTQQIISSYLLGEGIGYVWIIRVFLIIGLLTPCFIALNRLIKSIYSFFLFYTIVLLLLQTNIGIQHTLIRELLYYTLGYGIVFSLGLKLKGASIQELRISIGIVFICLASCAAYILTKGGGELLTFNHFKYPPALTISFGGPLSLFCYTIALLNGR